MWMKMVMVCLMDKREKCRISTSGFAPPLESPLFDSFVFTPFYQGWALCTEASKTNAYQFILLFSNNAGEPIGHTVASLNLLGVAEYKDATRIETTMQYTDQTTLSWQQNKCTLSKAQHSTV